ncbi:hypothetical protein MATL_G00060730 [Megalops atlanticus]|uniref:Uncharacterized protein n=1 Tax=Megalops atlanticus TaxID=7932 RepID=A0A9D3Q7W1_MEGAT|nr:hypothetical protein MATL_G00060730 [Megalops atlanticus]
MFVREFDTIQILLGGTCLALAGDLNLVNLNQEIVCASEFSPSLGMDIVFAKMAILWPVLLLLLALFNPLLSKNLPSDYNTGTTNSSMGALVPHKYPGRQHQPTTTGETKTIKTTTPNDHPADRDGFPCSTVTPRRDGLVGQCLIAIATLAGVATIFIVSTIILCTKLSSSKYRYRMTHNCGTEMVCISSLLPDGTHGRPRIPKSNGALIPSTEDSEGDNLTLHSFLPDTDRGS